MKKKRNDVKKAPKRQAVRKKNQYPSHNPASSRRSRTHEKLPYLLIVIGGFFLIIWGVHRASYNRSISLSDQVISSYSGTSDGRAEPVFIDAPGIGRLGIAAAGKTDGVWSISPMQANHVRQSAIPGQPGNIIIYGHNTKPVFGKLRKLGIGDMITVTTSEGAKHTYRIISKATVSPENTGLLEQTAEETLTVYTCAGWLDSMRLVIRAVPEN